MNNKKSIIASVALAATMLATSLSAFAYTDVSEDHWAKSYIDSLSGQKILAGYEDGTFRPDDHISRAEFAQILVNISGAIEKTNATLPDVADSAWYADTMKIAVNAGYIYGYDDGTYKPEGSITRQEAASMVYRAWGLNPEGFLGFTDNAKIAEWAQNPVSTLSTKDVIAGYPDGSFQPEKEITRAEAAKIIAKAITLGNIGDGTGTSSNVGTTSGAIHVGSSTTTGTTTSSSGGSSGGGSSSSKTGTKGSGGGSSSTTNGDAEPVNLDTPERGDVQVDTVIVEPEDVVAALDSSSVADDDKVTIQIALDDINGNLVSVSYLDPKTNTTKSYPTVTAFNEAMNDAGYTKEEVKKILDSGLSVSVPDTAVEGANPTITVAALDEDEKVIGEEDQDLDINYVILALRDFQAGKGDNSDLAVILNNYIDGYDVNSKAADKWLNTNARKLKVYTDVVESVADLFADEVIGEDNYKEFQGYFKSMTNIIDDALTYAAGKNGKLTKAQALSYFNTDVSAAVAKAVKNEKYTSDIQDAAIKFGSNLASKLDTLNKAVANAKKSSYKEDLILDVYNGDYK